MSKFYAIIALLILAIAVCNLNGPMIKFFLVMGVVLFAGISIDYISMKKRK